jgi:hypothetical protein
MLIGMAVFVPVKLALVSLGYAALLDTSSIDFQAWMGVFIAAPMVAWMRVRGCSWRDGAEMGGAMLGPVALVLALCGLGVPNALPWLTTNSSGTAMAIGMLAIMLYRRQHYTSGYSFIRFGRGQSAPELSSDSSFSL